MDSALRSPKIFCKEIEIPVPSMEDRFEILTKLLTDMRHELRDEHVSYLAESTHGFVGADLKSLCSQSAMKAVADNNLYTQYEDFLHCMKSIPPSAIKSIFVQAPNVS